MFWSSLFSHDYRERFVLNKLTNAHCNSFLVNASMGVHARCNFSVCFGIGGQLEPTDRHSANPFMDSSLATLDANPS